MSIDQLNKRMDRLDRSGGFTDADILAALDAGGARARAWREAGNLGPPPFDPLPPLAPDASRADREFHELLTQAHARVERARAAPRQSSSVLPFGGKKRH